MTGQTTRRDGIYAAERLHQLKSEQARLLELKKELSENEADLSNAQKRQLIYVVERLKRLKQERSDLAAVRAVVLT